MLGKKHSTAVEYRFHTAEKTPFLAKLQMKCIVYLLLLSANLLFAQKDAIYLGPTLSSDIDVNVKPESHYPLAVGNRWEYKVIEQQLEGAKHETTATWNVTVEIIAIRSIPQGMLYLRKVRFNCHGATSPKAQKYDPTHLFNHHLLVSGSYVFSIPFSWWDDSRNELIDSAKAQLQCFGGDGLIPDFFFPMTEDICWKNPNCEKAQIESRPRYVEAMQRILDDTKIAGDEEIVKHYQGFFMGSQKVAGRQTLVVEHVSFEDVWFLELNRLGGGSVCFFKEGIGPIFLSSARGGSTSTQISASL